MKRTHTQRTFAALTALGFLLFGAGDLFGLRMCPHHEAGLAVAHAGAHGAAAASAHDHHGSTDHSQTGDEQEPCNCGGFCPAVAGPATPVASGFSLHAAEIVVPDDVTEESGVVLPQVAHLLPYSHAPPIAD